jgi:hypothetical protein
MLVLHAKINLLLVSLTVCHSALTLRNPYVFRIDTVSAEPHLLVDSVYAECFYALNQLVPEFKKDLKINNLKHNVESLERIFKNKAGYIQIEPD